MANPLWEFDAQETRDADPQGVIGATLCMMSCTMTSGRPLHLPRIAANLAWLAENPKVNADLRIACRRLWQHWEGICEGLARDRAQPAAAAPDATRFLSTKH